MEITCPILRQSIKRLFFLHPFYSSLLLQLGIYEDFNIRTASTNGFHIRYNPVFAQAIGVEQSVGILIHEMCHVIFGHCGMRLPFGVKKDSEDANWKKWNRACDYAINCMLVNDGIKIPLTGDYAGLYDKKYENMSAEEIYELLPDKFNDSYVIDIIPSNFSDENKIEIAEKVQIALTSSKIAGRAPNGRILETLGRLKENTVNWRQMLEVFIADSVESDYSFIEPDKRFLQSGFVLPSMVSINNFSIVVAVDTSGSVSDEDFNVFISEIKHIIGSFSQDNVIDIILIFCDADIHKIQRINIDEDVEFIRYGNGGTSFEPPFQEIMRNTDGIFDNARGFIYFTDSESFPPSKNLEPDFPVLWLIRGRESSFNSFNPNFGEKVFFSKA